MGVQETTERAILQAENIGGIDHTEVGFEPGITVLEGRNATNRTSLLRALMAALGSERVSLKADAERGSVELEVGEETYSRTLTRTNGRVSFDGDPYLQDAELADRFAFLLESNDARRAVARGGTELRSIIMDPVDTDALEAEIRAHVDEKQQLDERLTELDELEDRLPGLTERQTSLEDAIDAKRREFESLESDIQDAESNVEETKETKAELEERMEALQEARRELETTTNRLDGERESLEEAREERDRLDAELSELSGSVAEERRTISKELSRLRSRKTDLEAQVGELQNLIQFNEDRLDGAETPLAGLQVTDSSGDVTDSLLEAETVSCWTCGTEVERDQIESTIGALRDHRAGTLEEVAELEDQIDSLQEELSDLEDRTDRREKLEDHLSDLEQEIDRRERRIADLEDRRTERESTIETLESEIDQLQIAESQAELLELHREANRLELEIDRLQEDEDSVTEEIAEIETRLEERADLRERRESIAEELTELRTRVDRIEEDAVSEFNDRMAELLDILEYANIDRIWLERLEGAGSGRGTESEFDLHVVRGTESGQAYEDTIDHLSESEREVTGLVFALAGYLVHDVAEELPFMLLDSIEAIDGSRIEQLLEYFAAHTAYLIVALLPEDAEAVGAEYRRIEEF